MRCNLYVAPLIRAHSIKLIRIVFCLCLSSVLFGCEAVTSQIRPVLEEDGEVYVYSRPFPQDTGGLRFTVDQVSAVRSDGSEVPLSLAVNEFSAKEMTRQRLVASGQLAPDSYRGLSFKVKDAHTMTEDGEAALLVPDQSVKVDFAFVISRKKAQMLSLTFRPAEAVRSGFSFSPTFSIFLPSRPLTGLIGYVSSRESNSVTIFDKKAGEVVGVIATGRMPGGMAMDPVRLRAYIAISGEDAVDVIDITAGEITNRIPLTRGDSPEQLALTPDGKVLLAASPGSKVVNVIDPISLMETDRINVGEGASSLLIDRAGLKAYVFNTISNTISIVDIPARSVSATVSTEPGPFKGQLSRQGDRLYVAYEWSPYITVIDPRSLSVLKRVFVRPGVSAIKVDTSNDLLYVGRKQEAEVEIYDPFSLIPGDILRAGGGVSYMTIDGEENNICMSVPDQRSVSLVNLISKKTVSVFDVGDGPYWITVMGER